MPAGRGFLLDREALGLGVAVASNVKPATDGRVSLAEFERVLRRWIMTLPGDGEVEATVVPSEKSLPRPP